MFLTRFRVNTARPGARRLLSSPQALHAAVMAAFPDLLPSEPTAPDGPRVLWRLDHQGRAEVLLYIVGPGRPDLTHLVEQAGWPAAAAADPARPGWQTRPYAPFLDRLAAGDRWAFRLTANPVHTIRRTPDEPRKITAHVTAVHQIRWLLQRQERCGFRVLEKPADQRLLPGGRTYHGKDEHHGDRYEVTVGGGRDLSFAKTRDTNGRRRGAPVTLVTATYDGRLEVTDPDALRRTLTQGVGRARAYGCGLITLAPMPAAAPARAS
ncbi:type I-E CRISPR-associated protein Cas6/Cse3/CasE [Streptomyces sp. NPDC005805]|uniref:type I-E CRISPR-associated protein Cas6/Cse3/CasE n=1 Tax=Streptomyces sp. NPDC005805 TaxID=3157068 RepID=UPI0033CD9722